MPRTSPGSDVQPARPVLWLLKRSTSSDVIVRTDEHPHEDDGAARIRCPLCDWQPASSSRWRCTRVDVPEHFSGGCGTSWNTFSTRGRCPGCGHHWRWTKCFRCDGWSLHDDWYEAGAPSREAP